jgi:hypothetical protein
MLPPFCMQVIFSAGRGFLKVIAGLVSEPGAQQVPRPPSTSWHSLALQRMQKWKEQKSKPNPLDSGFCSGEIFDHLESKSRPLNYNVTARFHRPIQQEIGTQHTLSTLRFKTFAFGAYFETVNNNIVLKIAFNLKRREYFGGLWSLAK